MKTTETRATKLDAVALYWSEAGQIGCLEPGHAPYPGSDTWFYGHWTKITRTQAQQFEREIGRQPTCETCATIERRAQEAQ